MKNKLLFALWGVLWIFCGLLGLMAEPVEGFRIFMRLAALGCFLPPVLLLRSKDARTVRLIRNLSAASLALTLLALVGNVLSLLGGVTLGNVMNVVLAIVSTPMFCSQIWVLSIFCWAFLMIAANKLVKKMKT